MEKIECIKWKDIEVRPISNLKEKCSSKELDEILYRINDILYFITNFYVTDESKEFLKKELVKAGTAIKKLSFTREDKKILRKNEILERLRKMYSNVECSYNPFLTETHMKKMCDYLTALFLKEKKNDELTEERKIEWIKRIKMFSKCYVVYKNVEGVQNELLKYFEVKSEF